MGQLTEEQFLWPEVDSCMRELTQEQFTGQLTEDSSFGPSRQLYFAGQLTEAQFVWHVVDSCTHSS